MSAKTEAAARFIDHVREKRFAEAAGTLSEDVVLTVPQIGDIPGRGGVETALRMASEQGRGLERVGWSAPQEQDEGTVLLSGKAPTGALGVVARLLRKQVAVAITCGFGDDGAINKLTIATS